MYELPSFSQHMVIVGLLLLLWMPLRASAAHPPHAANLKPVGSSCSLRTSGCLWGLEGAVLFCYTKKPQDFCSVVPEA